MNFKTHKTRLRIHSVCLTHPFNKQIDAVKKSFLTTRITKTSGGYEDKFVHNELRLIVIGYESLSGMDSKEKPCPPATISEYKCDGDSPTGDGHYLVTILMRFVDQNRFYSHGSKVI